MSMPVYLISSNYEHMPNGSLNEWENFKASSFSLEANTFFPTFWLLLFQQNNIHQARYIDDYDIDHSDTQIDREECFDEFGDSSFPYFIVSKTQAIENLRNRKTAFLNIFGQNFLQQYDDFQTIIHQYYTDHILLLTNGLDLSENSENEFRKELHAFELLEYPEQKQDDEYWNNLKNELRKYTDLNYFLYGKNYSEHKQFTYVENPYYDEQKTVFKDLPNWVYWIFGIIIAIPTIYIWLKTHSNLYAFLTFIVFAALFSFIAIKLTNQKPET